LDLTAYEPFERRTSYCSSFLKTQSDRPKGTATLSSAQRNSQRIFALKRILSVHADSRDTLERFRREAVTLASLRHPNILPIYELDETEDGLPFF